MLRRLLGGGVGDKVVLPNWVQGWASTRAKARSKVNKRAAGFDDKEELPRPCHGSAAL